MPEARAPRKPVDLGVRAAFPVVTGGDSVSFAEFSSLVRQFVIGYIWVSWTRWQA
jgi:hypothetical protein